MQRNINSLERYIGYLERYINYLEAAYDDLERIANSPLADEYAFEYNETDDPEYKRKQGIKRAIRLLKRYANLHPSKVV